MSEPMVQVSEALLDELREAADVAYKGPNDTDPAMLRLYADKIRRGYPGGGSNLTAAVARVLDVVADALAWQPTPTPEPPHIEDMAPGTTFTASALRGPESWTRQIDGVTDRHGNVWAIRELNPSTIRDVNPPEDAA